MRGLVLGIAAAAIACTAAWAQTEPGDWAPPAAVTAAAPPPPARDLREEVQSIEVLVRDPYGRQESRRIAVTAYRPPGAGPFPLAIVSHGRSNPERRANQGRLRFEHLARYLVAKGFAVFVPTRVGYGDTYGSFDPESSGACNLLRPQAAAQAAADQVLTTLAHASALPWVDASRWVAVGQSMGGLATAAAVARQPPGLVAAINFSGGLGGDPEQRPGNPCSPTAVQRLWSQLAATARLPMLWIYWTNDRYWGVEWPQRWARAWIEGGGQLTLHQLPAAGADGHSGMGIDMDRWVPLVESWLAQAGFTQPGTIARPLPTGYAAIEDSGKLPAPPKVRDGPYSRFLAAAARPRAMAIGDDGAAGFATGDWALGRALGYCQARRGLPCKLYAVDDDVVWVP